MRQNRIFGSMAGAIALCLCANFGRAGVLDSLFTDHVDITFPQYSQGAAISTNVAVAVRLSETNPTGFSYARIGDEQSYVRFAYVGPDGTEQVVPHEIEKWDPSGESLVWVRLPELSSSDNCRLTMYWRPVYPAKVTADYPNDPKSVWIDENGKNLVGVWHLNGDNVALDSSYYAATGSAGAQCVTLAGGFLGGAAGVTNRTRSGAVVTATLNDAIRGLGAAGNTKFTVSGWCYLNSADTENAYFFSRKTAESSDGWGLRLWDAPTNVMIYACSSKSGSRSSGWKSDLPVGKWFKFDMFYNMESKNSKLYVDGAADSCAGCSGSVHVENGADFAIGGLVGESASQTLNGYLDEVRITLGERSKPMRQVDYEAQLAGFAAFDAPVLGDQSWVREPSASQTTWSTETSMTEAQFLDRGEATFADETKTVTYYDRNTREVLSSAEIFGVGGYGKAGSYRVVVEVPAGERYAALSTTIDFRILDAGQYSPVLPDSESRILLFNPDDTSGNFIYQAYSYDGVSHEPGEDVGYTYWYHDEFETDPYVTSYWFNFFGGANHVYYSPDGTEALWTLTNVRIGNTFNNYETVATNVHERGTEGLWADQNYLPWNAESYRMNEDGVTVGDLHEYAGQGVMRNVLDASIASGYFTNGLGTVYFDAVNAFADAPESSHTIVVEIDAGTAAEPEWTAATMHVIRYSGSESTDLGAFESFDLNCTDGGTIDNFYRIYVPVNSKAKCRFRIRRTTVDPSFTVYPDEGGLILVDNVVATLPQTCVELMPDGTYDPTRSGKEVIGWENCWSVPFPSVADRDNVIARAVATVDGVKTSAVDLVASAKMCYRWRYLDQQVGAWQSVDLNASTLVALDALSLPGKAGDVEFYYVLSQSGKAFQFYDYTGTGRTIPGYSENRDNVECHGSDGEWFVRIRDGASDIESVRLEWRRNDTGAVATNALWLVDDGTWRGFVMTTNAIEGGITYRFLKLNEQTAGATWVENISYLFASDDAAELPQTTLFAESTPEAWADANWKTIPCDASTGYLMFQLTEKSKSLSIVRADYQNFNLWSDAHYPKFVGASIADETKSGVSPLSRSYECSYAGLADTPATNDLWEVRNVFTLASGESLFKSFTSSSVNGWTIGQGMWVNRYYREEKNNPYFALQLAGNGAGYLQMSNPIERPRGIESVSFYARLAQNMALSYDSLSTFDGVQGTVNRKNLTNYTFVARTAFDLKKNLGFSGDASVSLVAYYRAKEGCYEARWEQARGNATTDGHMTPKEGGQVLSIYRWDYSNEGGTATLLASATNQASTTATSNVGMKMPATDDRTKNLMPLFISAYDDGGTNTIIVAGVFGNNSGTGTQSSDSLTALNESKGYWHLLSVRDKSDSRKKAGSYGVISANCEAYFARPEYYGEKIAMQNGAFLDGVTLSFKAASIASCYDAIAGGDWEFVDGRIGGYLNTTADFGLYAEKVNQTISLYTQLVGAANSWQLAETFEIDDFGDPQVSTNKIHYLWSTDDLQVRLQTGGSLDGTGVRTDVAVDNVVVRQWRGTNWVANSSYGPTNFVYTSGWLDDGTLELSAKRTAEGTPCSIRTPIFDGTSGRGSGLGEITFKYTAAQENAAISLQISTNVNAYALGSLTVTTNTYDGNGSWVEVHRWVAGAADASSNLVVGASTNVATYALGIHGVRGVMRLVVPSELVSAVKDSRDEAAFGSVRILEVACTDEPKLDSSCWWGWNLRTIGDATDSEGRMYLPDASKNLVDVGKSLALNNTTAASTLQYPERDAESVIAHDPFVQSPTLTNAVAGQVTFLARTYDVDVPAVVSVLAFREGDVNDDSYWETLAAFTVTNNLFERFTYRTSGENYCCFRLAVTNVAHASAAAAAPVRVLIDEVTVSEAVLPRLGFRNVGAFRSDMEGTSVIAAPGSKDEQPLAGEGWGVQAELYDALGTDEIDSTYEPRVRLWWYEGEEPWGFENWRDQPQAESGWLKLVDTERRVYRSTYAAGGSVIPPSDAGTTVQFMLEVEYRLVDAVTGEKRLATNRIERAEWSTPEWYAPVDYNESLGGNVDFSPYCLLDVVAPGWAWINEINFYARNSSGGNDDSLFQYVEIAAPADADLSRWEIRFLEPSVEKGTIITNRIARFGSTPGLEGTKHGLLGTDSGMVFHVVGTKFQDGLEYADGTLDALWRFETYTSTFRNRGGVDVIDDCEMPFAVELVRPSGVVEHAIVVVGTNRWGATYRDYNVSNVVAFLNAASAGVTFIAPGDDSGDATDSLGVFQNEGAATGDWNNTMVKTPGRKNADQTINPDYPKPSGSEILLIATVDQSNGEIRQSVGEIVDSTESVRIYLKRGSESGTNITYSVGNWLEVGDVLELDISTGVVVTNKVAGGQRTCTVEVGKAAANNITVTVCARAEEKLRKEYGIDENNAYTPAVLDWLSKSSDIDGNGWADPDSGNIYLAEFHALNNSIVTNLTLTQMYWLDMDPTVSNVFKAGIVRALPRANVSPWPGYQGDEAVTNCDMWIYMMISNVMTGKAWAPYVLRGLDPNYTSLDYGNNLQPALSESWTSETFKVTGILANGFTSEQNAANWVNLDFFVFHRDSFYGEGVKVGGVDRSFQSEIEILDPHHPYSLGYNSGWGDWFRENPLDKSPIFFSWNLDTSLRPQGVRVLKQHTWPVDVSDE